MSWRPARRVVELESKLKSESGSAYIASRVLCADGVEFNGGVCF